MEIPPYLTQGGSVASAGMRCLSLPESGTIEGLLDDVYAANAQGLTLLTVDTAAVRRGETLILRSDGAGGEVPACLSGSPEALAEAFLPGAGGQNLTVLHLGQQTSPGHSIFSAKLMLPQERNGRMREIVSSSPVYPHSQRNGCTISRPQWAQ